MNDQSQTNIMTADKAKLNQQRRDRVEAGRLSIAPPLADSHRMHAAEVGYVDVAQAAAALTPTGEGEAGG